MKTLTIKINDKKFNKLHELAGACQYPTNKKVINEMNLYVAKILINLGLDRYEGFDRSDFYDWIQKKIRTKFKLKEYQD